MLSTFSYSLYLTHVLLLTWPLDIVRLDSVLHLSLPVLVGLRCGIGLPLSISFAYLFHLAFERPFMKSRRPVTHFRAWQWADKKFVLSAAPANEDERLSVKTPG